MDYLLPPEDKIQFILCPVCDGTGLEFEETCSHCNGSKEVEATEDDRYWNRLDAAENRD